MSAEEYLSIVEKMKLLIDNMFLEKEELRAIATRVTCHHDGMPHGSGVSDRVSRGVMKMMEKDAEIDRAVEVLLNLKSEIVGQIQKLQPEEYDVLYKSYIHGMTLTTIADTKGRALNTIKSIRRRGLCNLQILWSDNLKEALKLLK